MKAKDFVLKKVIYAGNKFGKRQYINETKNREFLNRLSRYFENKVTVPRMRRGAHARALYAVQEFQERLLCLRVRLPIFLSGISKVA